MPINTLEFNTKLTTELDKVLVQKAVTGFMADSALRAKFVGAKTVLIPEVGMTALGDYDRDEGFVRGSITVSNYPFTLQMDRAASFQLDSEDADETGISNLIGQVTTEFVRTKAVPEMDAYVLSKLGSLAIDNEQTTVMGDDSLKTLNELMLNVQEANGYGEDMVAFVDRTFYSALINSPSVSRQLVVSDFKSGGVNTKVNSINGCPIIPVDAARMKTAYTFYDGATEGQKEGGFVPVGTAKSIRLLVMPKNGASLVKKTEKTRTFAPGQNIKADAYKVDYRVYYDLFVKNSKKNTIWAVVE